MLDRRSFLGLAAGGAALAASPASARPQGANERIVVGVMGCSRSNSGRNPGRGSTLAIGMAGLPGAEVAYVCDVDEKYLAAVTADVSAKQSRPPKAVKDFRRILDDRSVDALVIATPDTCRQAADSLSRTTCLS